MTKCFLYSLQIYEMEFAHLIKSPRVEKVVVHRHPFQKSVEGALCITGHHLIFSAGGANPDEFWVNFLKELD